LRHPLTTVDTPNIAVQWIVMEDALFKFMSGDITEEIKLKAARTSASQTLRQWLPFIYDLFMTYLTILSLTHYTASNYGIVNE
jgi:hypothetical protein